LAPQHPPSKSRSGLHQDQFCGGDSAPKKVKALPLPGKRFRGTEAELYNIAGFDDVAQNISPNSVLLLQILGSKQQILFRNIRSWQEKFTII